MVPIKALLTGLLDISLYIMKKNVWYLGVIVAGLLAIAQTANADWQKNNAAQGNIYCFGVNGTNMFAGGNGAILYSSDTGTNWTLVDSGLPKGKAINSIAISGTNTFAGTGTGSGFNSGSGIYLSTNNGAFWTRSIPDCQVKQHWPPASR